MSDNGSGSGAGVPAPPPGAVVLTEALLRRTSRRWERLPALSLKVSRKSTAVLLEEGWIQEPAFERLEGETEEAYGARRAAEVDARATALRDHGVWVELQVVGMAEAVRLQPTIPGQDQWPEKREDRIAAYVAWREALAPEERERYDELVQDAEYKLIVLGLATPKLRTLEDARQFKDDGVFLGLRIAELSGFNAQPASAEAASADLPAPEPAAGE